MEKMSTYRSDLPERPARIARLPLDERGYPVPWFVAWIDGKPDFRVIRPHGIEVAHKHKTCWLCGEPLGRYGAFLIGPMCGINRTIAEPPSHRECAEYAVRACPFLTRPFAKRNERGLEGTFEPAGVMIKRNPGVTLLWVTREWRPFRVDNGYLFRLGDPTDVAFYREGRAATRSEVEASVTSGLPLLEEPAREQGPHAIAALNRMRAAFETLLPAA